MKKHCMIIALLALVMLAVMPPVQGWTVQMSNPDGVAQRDVIVYFPNGTVWGSYNTTSLIDLGVIANSSSFIFTLKPQYVNVLDDPANFLDQAFVFVSTNAIPIFVIAGLIGIILMRR